MNKQIDWMNLALKQAKKAYKQGDVPVGAVIIKDNKLIAKAYNQKEKKNNVIKHAEIIAIEKACKKLKTWHLDDCIMYVTLEPCMMCTGAIVQSRIKKIVYATPNPNYGFMNTNYEIQSVHNIEIQMNDDTLSEESSELLKQFFKEQRK